MNAKQTSREGKITVTRTTEESRIRASLDPSARRKDLKKGIRTPLQFFNHMLETLSWRACVNVEADVELTDYRLTHVICEDTGITLGEAFEELHSRAVPKGVNGAGSAVCCIDEALARCVVSFEGRPLLTLSPKLAKATAPVEDMQASDLVGFLEGFVQGARLTLHADLIRGTNPHHVWESVFRALGDALRAAFEPCPWRSGAETGVKGKVRLEKD
ncbi:MAG: hypothetical protein AB1742_09325 [bacterium]